MLQLNLGNLNVDAMVSASTAAATLPSRSAWIQPAVTTPGTRTPGAPSCGYGFTHTNGVCMSQGCVDGRSPCVVKDAHGRTCSYDQLLAFQHQSGIASCGPAPMLPPAPSAPEVSPPGLVVDVSPSPGTQAVAIVPASQLGPYAGFRVPRWALVVGGLAIAGIVFALLARR